MLIPEIAIPIPDVADPRDRDPDPGDRPTDEHKNFYRNSQKNLAKGVDNSSEYCYDISVVNTGGNSNES